MEKNHVFVDVSIFKKLIVLLEVFSFSFLTFMTSARGMHSFVTIVYNVTSGKSINLLASAIVSISFLVSKQVLRCPRDD